jgi:hypothetical protein
MLDWSSLLDVVMRVSNHVVFVLYQILLIHFRENVGVCVVLEVHYNY